MTRSIPGLIAIALAAILVLQWINWPPDLAPSESGQTPPNASVAQDLPTPGADLLTELESEEPKEAYAAVVEHPLFRPDRKPKPPEDSESEVEETPEVNQELDGFDLSAVLISPAVVSAWVKDPSKPKLQRLRIGDDFMGWSVREILEDRVRLERQGEQDELILRDYSKSAPAIQAPRPSSRTPSRQRPPRPPRPTRSAPPPKKQ